MANALFAIPLVFLPLALLSVSTDVIESSATDVIENSVRLNTAARNVTNHIPGIWALKSVKAHSVNSGQSAVDALISFSNSRMTVAELYQLLDPFCEQITAAETQLLLQGASTSPNFKTLDAVSDDNATNSANQNLEVFYANRSDFWDQSKRISNMQIVKMQTSRSNFLRLSSGGYLFEAHSNNCAEYYNNLLQALPGQWPMDCTELSDYRLIRERGVGFELKDFGGQPITLSSKPGSATIAESYRNVGPMQTLANSTDTDDVTLSYINVVKDVYIFRDGDFFTGNHKVRINNCGKIDKLENRKQRKSYNRVFTIAMGYFGNFYHASIDALQRISLYMPFLMRNQDIKLHMPWYHDSLAKVLTSVGFSEDRIVVGTIFAKIGFIPAGSQCGASSLAPVRALSVLNRQPFEGRELVPPSHTVVLIKRSNKRWLANHDEILEMLREEAQPYRLNVVEFKDDPAPSFEQTREIFNSAVMVAGPHGAGFVNIIYSNPGTCVIEVMSNKGSSERYKGPKRWFSGHFLRLAQFLGHIYHVQLPKHGEKENGLNATADDLRPFVRSCLKFRLRSGAGNDLI
eukprot:Selendium_serpulae@DN6505_c0_g1_i4.p1